MQGKSHAGFCGAQIALWLAAGASYAGGREAGGARDGGRVRDPNEHFVGICRQYLVFWRHVHVCDVSR